MLLFFFMVVTVLRDAELKVSVSTPQVTELTKLEEKSLVNYLYIGRPIERYQAVYGTKPRLQLGDKFASIAEIPIFLEQHKIKVPEAKRPRITSSLRVDGEVTMGIVYDVKEQLRKSDQLKINYSAKKRASKI
jgi:biopolymer transport protein ExbD